MAKKSKPEGIQLPFKGGPLLKQILEAINSNEEVNTLWKITNVHAIKRLGMTDHGVTHFQIVVNNALNIQRLLLKHDLKMSAHVKHKCKWDKLMGVGEIGYTECR
jgi:metal-dependent HD superfamily phosphatase/phosphodiesterase